MATLSISLELQTDLSVMRKPELRPSVTRVKTEKSNLLFSPILPKSRTRSGGFVSAKHQPLTSVTTRRSHQSASHSPVWVGLGPLPVINETCQTTVRRPRNTSSAGELLGQISMLHDLQGCNKREPRSASIGDIGSICSVARSRALDRPKGSRLEVAQSGRISGPGSRFSIGCYAWERW
jgi:hypothetical protein